jgi:Domain of unknown function (DUF1937)
MTYHYLASPYTHPSPAVMEQRYELAQNALNWLLAKRVWAYSPIVHCHPLVARFDLPRHADFWASFNRAMLSPAIGLLILDIDGWTTSKGIELEIRVAHEERTPISLLRPTGHTYTRKLYWMPPSWGGNPKEEAPA